MEMTKVCLICASYTLFRLTHFSSLLLRIKFAWFAGVTGIESSRNLHIRLKGSRIKTTSCSKSLFAKGLHTGWKLWEQGLSSLYPLALFHTYIRTGYQYFDSLKFCNHLAYSIYAGRGYRFYYYPAAVIKKNSKSYVSRFPTWNGPLLVWLSSELRCYNMFRMSHKVRHKFDLKSKSKEMHSIQLLHKCCSNSYFVPIHNPSSPHNSTMESPVFLLNNHTS